METEQARLEKLYKTLQPLAMNTIAPRVGWYLITETFEKLVDGINLKMAKAKWKPEVRDKYIIDVEIQLMSFLRNPYNGSDQILNRNLVNMEIEVKGSSRLNGLQGKFVVDWVAIKPNENNRSADREEEQEIQLIDAIEKQGEVDEVSMAIEMQLSQDSDILNAALLWEDMVLEDEKETNDWIFAIQAQDLNEKNNVTASNKNI